MVPTSATHIYHPERRAWVRGPNLPQTVQYAAAVHTSDRLLLAGGMHDAAAAPTGDIIIVQISPNASQKANGSSAGLLPAAPGVADMELVKLFI